jgi:hypothetical protein
MLRHVYRASKYGINPWDYWVFGLYLSYSVLKDAEEHSVSETESVSVLRRGGGRQLLGPYERANRNHWTTYVSIR